MKYNMARPDNKIIIAGIVGLLGLLMLIAGGIMLGIGIHKSNQKTETTVNSIARAKYLTLKAPTNFSSSDLQNDTNYKTLIDSITKQLKGAVQNNPIVNVISASVPSRYKRDISLDSSNSADVLAVLIYTSDSDENTTDIINRIAQSGTGLQVLNIYDDQTISRANYSSSLCTTVNPNPYVDIGSTSLGPTVTTGSTQSSVTSGTGSTQSPGTGSTQSPGTATTGTTQSATSGTTQSSTTTQPVPYTPCPMYINMIVDASNGLTADQFQMQLSFLAFDVFGVDWTHFERLNYGSYADRFQYYGFVDGTNRLDIQKDIITTSQVNGSAANIRTVLQALDNQAIGNLPLKLSTIVFLSTVNEANINNSVSFAQSLQNKGRFTIVALGSASSTANEQILRRLTPNIISWDLTKPQPDNWQSAFWNAYGCNGTAPTDTPPAPTTTLSLPLTTATPPIPYQPCQNWIIILFDSSINLTSTQFISEKVFLANNVFSSVWTHFERLAISNFNAAPDDGLTFGDKTLNQIHSYVLTAIQPQNALPNITAALAYANNLASKNSSGVYTILFTSTAAPSDVAQATVYSQSLNNYGGLSIVTMGSNDFSALSALSTHILSWPNPESQASPPNYLPWFNESYGCGGSIVPPTSLTSTPSTPSEPYCFCTNCNKWITIIIDTSNAMSPSQFTNQKAFIENYLLDPSHFNHYERLTIIQYQRNATHVHFNSTETYNDVKSFIDNNIIQISITDPQVSSALSLASSIYTNKTVQMITILFTSTADPTDIGSAAASAQALRTAGRFTVVTIGDNVFDPITNSNFADYVINWPSGLTPSDWQNNFLIAFMCNPVPSTTATQLQTSVTTPVQTSTTTVNPAIYFPCRKYFVFIIDYSNGLTSAQFNAEINFISNSLLSDLWTHLENVGVEIYSETVDPRNFNASTSIDGIRKIIRGNNQTTTTPSLYKALITANNVYQNMPYNISFILFTSTTNGILRFGTIDAAKNLANKGKLTVVTMGTADFSLIANISSNIIPWNDMSQLPTNWPDLFWNSYDCNTPMPSTQSVPTSTIYSTSIPTTSLNVATTTSSATTTGSATITSPTSQVSVSSSVTNPVTTNTVTISTINPAIYYPCQKYFVLIIDYSNGLSTSQFNAEINFITNNLFSDSWTHFENIGLEFYSNVANSQGFNSSKNLNDVRQLIRGNQQSNEAPSLYTALNSANSTYTNVNGNVSFILFTSTTNGMGRFGAYEAAQALANKGKLSVVTMGTADFSLISNISTNFIPWPDMTQLPTNWAQLLWDAYGCNTPMPSTQSPVSSTATPTLLTSTNIPSSTGNTILSTSTASTSTYCLCTGCDRWVTIIIDASNGMSTSAFNNQKTFVTNYLLGSGSFNHFERLAVIIYTDNVIANASFGSFQTHDDLFNYINNITQNVNVNTPKITPALNFALNYINATSPTVMILFTSSADPADISTANSAAQQLRTAGRFSVVTIGDQVFNAITTTNFADYVISWTSGSTPTNWETYFKISFMCSPLPATTTTPLLTTISTMIPVSTTTINPEIYLPCKKFFVFIIDISNKLSTTQFNQEIDFITNNLFGSSWTHLEAVGLEFYSDLVDPRGFYSYKSVDEIRKVIRGNNQTSTIPNLNKALITAVNTYQNDTSKISYILFTSSTNGIGRAGTIEAAQNLASRGRLTVVTMGTSDFTLISNISTNVISWNDMTQPPSNWETLFSNAYDCNNTSTAPPLTSTLSVQSTSSNTPSNTQTTAQASSTFNLQTTTSPTSTQATSAATTNGPTVATTASGQSAICNAYIALAIDNTNGLSTQDFNSEMSFLSDTQNGLLSLYNQTITTSWYPEGNQGFFGGYSYSNLVQFINQTNSTTNNPYNWKVFFGQMVADSKDNNIYTLTLPLNNIFLLGASPPDDVISDITSLSTLQTRPVTVIGVPLNSQVIISPSIINAGMQVVPWNNDHNALTLAIRSIMKC